WKDTGIRLEGDAVWSFTVMFLEMWNTCQFTDEEMEKYQYKFPKNLFEDGYVQPYGDTPLDREVVGENVYINIINAAKRYVYIYTPYLIVDNEMISAITLAAKRGVDVRIVTPGIPDKKMVYWMTQSYYS
ncbi:MAG: phospholipase D-like domain-containing protein, partial [Acetivibrio sp.]